MHVMRSFYAFYNCLRTLPVRCWLQYH